MNPWLDAQSLLAFVLGLLLRDGGARLKDLLRPYYTRLSLTLLAYISLSNSLYILEHSL